MTEKLKPCPFCRGEARARAFKCSYPGSWAQVVCKVCDGRGPEIKAGYSDRYDPEGLKARAVEAWNQRATDAR